MKDESKTKAQLVSELKGLSRRIADLEALETESEKAVKVPRENEEFFRAFMENNPAVMYLKNDEGRHIYGNQTLFKYFNFKPDSFIGTTNHDIFPSEIADHLYEVDRTVRAENKVVELKEWCDIRGDEERWWKEIKFPVLSNKGVIFVGGIAINITELKQAKENYKKQLQFEKLISELSGEFINLPFDEIDGKIDESLKRIGETIDLDRVILHEFSDEKQQLRLSHQFLKPGVQKPESIIANKDQPGFTKTILNSEIINVERVADLPEEYELERKYLREQGVKSGLAIPLIVEKKPVGALTFTTVFHERSWTDQDVKQLQLITEILANALDRKRKEQKIRNALEKIEDQMLFDNLLSRLSTEYINLPFDQFDQKIEDGLELIAKQLGIKRIAFLQFSRDKSQLNLTHTYSIDSRQRAPIFLVSEQLPWFSESLRQGKTLRISRIDEMPEEAVAEKQYAKEQGFKSFVTIPMKVAELVIGAISYSSMTSEGAWSDELVQRLTLVSEIFANMLDRKFKEQNLRDAYTNIEQLKNRLENENLYLRQEIEVTYRHDEIVGKSEAIKQVLSQAEVVSRQDTSVLILGETGTGKELVAHAIHNMSTRKNRAMITVNCAALPSLLIESEMFGREKGAFTGALTRQIGRFEAANGSTIFLDEIGDLPKDMQVKLLRVVQEGQFERLGSTKTITVDVRVIAATNQDLHKAVREGEFRRDLFYRFNVFPITVPPLRDRREDIPLLLWSFVREYEKAMGIKIESITNQTIDLMQAYSWPGNVRELKNVIERAMILNTGPVLHIDLLESEEAIDRPMTLEDVSRHHILKVLKNTGWRVSGKNGAAEILGLKRTTLQTKMKSLNIQRAKD